MVAVSECLCLLCQAAEVFDVVLVSAQAFLTRRAVETLAKALLVLFVRASQLLDGELSPAPEPGEVATLSMMGLGLGGLILRARKRRMADASKAA